MISPFSVYTLLMLIAEGAEGESLKQIANALKIDSNLREVRDLFNILNGTLSAPSDGVFLSQFNALITDTNRPIPREYEDNMEKIYKADIIPVDFTNPNAVYNNINSYVSNKTNGQIRKIVRPEDVIKAQLMLLSGIYFQGKWQKVFNRSFTQQEDFFDVAGNKIGRVDMMFQRGSFPYAAVAELEAHLLELPYGNDNTMSMVLVLPRKGAPIANILNNLNTYGMNLVMEELEKARIEYEDDEVEVHLPKFTTNTETNMQQLLENMGILDIFTGSANLSKLSKSNSYYISALVHKTKIQVDEEGTVAAAVSSAIFANKATPPKFLANRPFLYFIIEKRTNLVLFCGQHIKPKFSTNNETYSNKIITKLNSRFGIEKDIAVITDGAQNFAMKLVKSLNQISDNFVVSSFSIYTSLLVAAEGSDGISLEELQKTLSFTDIGSLRIVHRTLNYILRYARPAGIYKSLVLVTDINRPPMRDFEDISEHVYKTEIYPVNFLKPLESLETINHLFKNESRGYIENVVKLEDVIKAQLMLLSVDYFHGKWENSFERSLTKQEDFFDSYGVVKGKVDMMYQSGSILFTAVGDLNSYIIELPIGDDHRTSMIIVLPREGIELKKVIQKINKYGFKRIVTELETAETKSGYQDLEVAIPRFTYTFDFNLQTVLERMGINAIFTKEANFQKVSASNSYYISALIHKTKIEINEEGFEDFPDVGNYFKSPKLIANRPFLYFIVEKTTNLLMFCGQFQKPNSSNN
ncbi:unnamed protein product [Diamesa tonsa]